jgi:hypothetical protein
MIFHLDICAHVGQEQYYKNVFVVCGEVRGPGPIFNFDWVPKLEGILQNWRFYQYKNLF